MIHMDIATMITIIGIALVGIMAILGSIYGGFVVAVLLSTITLIGLAVLPSTPIIPIWVAVLVIIGEVLFIAYNIAKLFGLGSGGGTQ